MLDFIKNIPHNIYEHFATMTTLLLVATIVKIVIFFLNLWVNRYYNRKSIKHLMKQPGMTEERAEQIVRDMFGQKKRPKMLTKIKTIFSKSKTTPE